jgi:O-6-methylguanine DNA methyltransferase
LSLASAICSDVEPLIIATAMGDDTSADSARIRGHIEACASCRIALEQYRNVNALVVEARLDSGQTHGPAAARKILQRRLTDLRERLLTYGLFPSSLGPVLIARSEEGVALVEFLARRNVDMSRLGDFPQGEVIERRRDLEPLYQELLDYLGHRRTNLSWPLDLRFTRSDFQRRVLRMTTHLPYGAVASYLGIARKIGKPRGMRAVAQALRWNPLPIVIPCHRVIGASGFLAGYAGGKTSLKRLLLGTEGVPIVKSRREFKINMDAMYACAPGDQAYCLPTCRSLKRLRPGRATLFASRSTAEGAGLRPCRTCRPDLYSLSGEVASCLRT